MLLCLQFHFYYDEYEYNQGEYDVARRAALLATVCMHRDRCLSGRQWHA
jgi:hypothetical protein